MQSHCASVWKRETTEVDSGWLFHEVSQIFLCIFTSDTELKSSGNFWSHLGAISVFVATNASIKSNIFVREWSDVLLITSSNFKVRTHCLYLFISPLDFQSLSTASKRQYGGRRRFLRPVLSILCVWVGRRMCCGAADYSGKYVYVKNRPLFSHTTMLITPLMLLYSNVKSHNWFSVN